jgi:hypothetical protein
MNLHEARIHVLKLLDGGADQRIPVSPDLAPQMRVALQQLIFSDTLPQEQAAMTALQLLRDKHGLPFFPCLLEHSFLLHNTYGAKSLFEPLFIALPAQCGQSETLKAIFVNELARYSESPYDTTRELVQSAIRELARTPGFLAELLGRTTAPFRLRKVAAECVIAKRDVSSYPGVVGLFAEQASLDSQHFIKYALPLLRDFVPAGEPALKAAFDTLGFRHQQMPKVCQEFGDTFHSWFWKSPPRPTDEWARILLRSWRRSKSLDQRDKMLNYILDEYCSDPHLANFVRKEIRNALADQPTSFSACSAHVQDKIDRFAGSIPQDIDALSQKLVRLAENARTWDTDPLRQRLKERWEGKALADAVLRVKTDECRERILSFVATADRKRLLNGFFHWIAHPDSFFALPVKSQLHLISHSMAKHSTSENIAMLLAKEPSDEVRNGLERLRDKLDAAATDSDVPSGAGEL